MVSSELLRGGYNLPMLRWRCFSFALAISLLFFPSLVGAQNTQDAQNTRNVLVVQQGYAGQSGSVRFAEGFREVLDASVPNQIFNEFLDEDRLKANDATLVEVLRKRYKGKKFDLIVGAGLPALKFLLPHKDELWPGTPAIFIFVDQRQLPSPMPPNATAVTFTGDAGPTLDLALRLMPNTRHVFYVAGSSPNDKARLAIAQQDFERHAGRIEFNYISDLPLGELLLALGRLPADSLVIYGGIEQDASGRSYLTTRLAPLIAAASNVPVFGSYDTYFERGIVGGRIHQFKDLGAQTANLGLRVMNRGTATGVPVENWQSQTVVDWRALQRWKINENRLPPGTIVNFRTPSVWQQYKWYVLTCLMVIIVLLAILALLVTEMRRRKRADLAVRDLSGRLINVREEERKRIAHELHEDISQRLSLVAVELEMLETGLVPSKSAEPGSVQQPLQELRKIITDTHDLAHNLHSSNLEVLGLEQTLKGLCREFAERHHLHIEVRTDNISSSLPKDLALCLYRVAQDALDNAVKHSGATRVEVSVAASDGIVRMKIKDDGSGFEPSSSARGLGLATMRERLRQLGGKLLVRSRPGEGTEVTAEARLEMPVPRVTGSTGSAQNVGSREVGVAVSPQNRPCPSKRTG